MVVKKYFMRNIFIMMFVIFFTMQVFADDQANRTQALLKNLRCLVCQGQSIYDSSSDFAQDIKFFVKTQIESGKTDNEIYDFLANKYGNWILLNPPLNLTNIFLWILPIILLALGFYFIYRRSKFET